MAREGLVTFSKKLPTVNTLCHPSAQNAAQSLPKTRPCSERFLYFAILDFLMYGRPFFSKNYYLFHSPKQLHQSARLRPLLCALQNQFCLTLVL